MQPYDPLDHRKPYFEVDYDKYMDNVAQIDMELKTFFYNFVSHMPNITQALWLIER
jgi:dynein heavy chain